MARLLLESVVATLLRAGVIAAALIGFSGAAIYVVDHGTEHPDYRVFHGEPLELRTLTGVARSAAAGQGQGIIQIAVLVLIATPVARVIFAAYGFVRTGDTRYTFVALAVLAILAFTLYAAKI